MRSLSRACLVALAVLCTGPSDAAAAEEIYSMAKFTLCKLPEHPFEYISVTASTAFSHDGARVAIASDEHTVHFCETAGNRIKALTVPSALAEGDEYANFLALNADGSRLVTASKDKLLRLWDTATGQEIAALEHVQPVYFAAFSPDGSRLISSVLDDTPQLWDAATGGEIAKLRQRSRFSFAAFSPDGKRLATAGADGSVQLWDAATGREIAMLSGHTAIVYDVAFSADGKTLLTASEDNTARSWDIATGVAVLLLKHSTPVYSAAFSDDGKKIVTAAGTEGHIFDAALGREVFTLKGHEATVNDARFSPDATRIVTASSDHSIRVWDAERGEAVAVMQGHIGGATFAAFTPEGGRIVSIGGPDGLAWTRLAPGKLPESAAGVWYTDFGTPEEPLPPEFVKEMCVSNPVKVGSDGLVVMFEGMGGSEPPPALLHLRCSDEKSCLIFAAAPAQGLEVQGEGTIAFDGDRADLCMAGECRALARCPAG